MSDLTTLLESHHLPYRSVIPFDLTAGGPVVFDFTATSSDFAHIDINDVTGFTGRLFDRIAEAEIPVGIGRYNEDRVLSRPSPLFNGEAVRRSVHLGIDLFVTEGTEVMTPLPCRIQSVADNAGLGNYGPTVILEHELEDTRFWTLYGHLGRDSVFHLDIGAELIAGETFAEIGEHTENGGWPPHLHFQIISDLGDHTGDFPGVAAPTERDHWLGICPDPNLILGIPHL